MKHPVSHPGVTCLSDAPGTSVAGSADRPDIDLREWYPLVRNHVPTPHTAILGLDERTADHLMSIAWDERSEPAEEALDALAQAIEYESAAHRLMSERGIFLRTGHMSAKHEWDQTCRVKPRADVRAHIMALVEASLLADIVGMPIDTWVIREMVPVTPSFHAFGGHMPITREFRYFIEDGWVLGWQPYWPPAAFTDQWTSDPDWERIVVSMNISSDREVGLLTELATLVAENVPGAWSVDFLQTTKGWKMIDMAHAERSFVWDVPTLGPARKWLKQEPATFTWIPADDLVPVDEEGVYAHQDDHREEA